VTGSLRARLLIAATLVLVLFLGLTALALDRAVRESLEEGVHGYLEGQLYGLLAAAELGPDGSLQLPDSLPENRFSVPASGLYARASTADGDEIWRSGSLLGRSAPGAPPMGPGQQSFRRVVTSAGDEYFVLDFGVAWEIEGADDVRFVITVMEDTERFSNELNAFRRTLVLWLGAAALVLLLAQAWVLHWVLHPLRRVMGELQAVEDGKSDAIRGVFPNEISALTDRLNSFIRTERSHLMRYRNTLGDLAHSLKTPLAVLRGLTEGRRDDDGVPGAVAEQVDRMDAIVRYQLQRTVSSGQGLLARPVAIAPAVAKVVRSLDKVYADKGVRVTVDVEEGLRYGCDEGDLLEVVGNLADNAYKWCRKEVAIEAAHDSRDGVLSIAVRDDGDGIAPDRIDAVTRRGVRGDEREPGQGIGLGVVREIVESYGGSLSLTNVEPRGFEVRATFATS
jgi:two-component system sensor histidine kinase PhoQ